MKIVKLENIQELILDIGDEKVLLDRDVADIYGVETKRINEAVKNNIERFPDGHIFEIDKETKNELVENFDRFKKTKAFICTSKSF